MKILKIFLFFLLNFYFIQSEEQTFNNALADLEDLESYIKEYITEKSYKETSLTHLIVCYIRLGAYTSGNWELTGNIPEDLAEYISSKDEENETSAGNTQKYGEIIAPNGDKINFVHLFSVMNGIESGNSYTEKYAHFAGWGGDTELLLESIMNQDGDLESLIEYAKSNYFLIKGGFEESDLISDLDGPIILSYKNDNNNFADILGNYYSNKDNNNRVNKFIKLTFPNLVNRIDKESFRNELYKIFNDDYYIQIDECKKGMRDSVYLNCYMLKDIKEQYAEQQKAAVYVVSDYLFDNYKPSNEDDEQKDSDGSKNNSDKFLKRNFILLLLILECILY